MEKWLFDVCKVYFKVVLEVLPFATVVAFKFVFDAVILLAPGAVILVFPLVVVFPWENADVAMEAKNIALSIVNDNAIPILNVVFLLLISYNLFRYYIIAFKDVIYSRNT
jgi:hypothetical protein